MVGRNVPSWACHGGGLFNVLTFLIVYFLLSAIDRTCDAQLLYYVIQMLEYGVLITNETSICNSQDVFWTYIVTEFCYC